MAQYKSSQDDMDLSFRALGDATRRAVIGQLCEGDAAVSDLAAPHDMALPTFMKHLKVLETAGLISTQKTGRVRTCRLEPDRLRAMTEWIDRYEQSWRTRVDQLSEFLDKAEDTQ